MIELIKNKVMFKYIIVGILTVIIDYSVLYLFYTVLNIYYITAILLGFLFSNLFQFYMNFFYTFELEKNDIFYQRMIMYTISAIIGILLGTATIVFFESYFHSLYLSKTLSLFVNFAYGFLASKYIVFNTNIRLRK